MTVAAKQTCPICRKRIPLTEMPLHAVYVKTPGKETFARICRRCLAKALVNYMEEKRLERREKGETHD